MVKQPKYVKCCEINSMLQSASSSSERVHAGTTYIKPLQIHSMSLVLLGDVNEISRLRASELENKL